jgi:phosphoglycolate phosphatase-like HAD superfamily hydrolase
MSERMPIDAVLFDLDGTLLDTAPDMAAALNALRAEVGIDRLSFADIRSHVSHGGAALVRPGFPHARDAGMRMLIARYGYLGTADQPEGWRADGIIDRPAEILAGMQNGAATHQVSGT